MDLDFLKNITQEDFQKLALLFQAANVANAGPILPSKTIVEFTDEYLNYMKQKKYSKAYYISMEFTLKKLIKYFGTGKTLKELDTRSAQNFIFFLQENASRGVANYLRNLKAAFNQAIAWEYIEKNIFKKITILKVQKATPEFITEEELKLICKHVTNKNIKDMITFSFYTGARLSEVINLTFKDIDFTERVIHIGRSYTTKSRKIRIVPICDTLLDTLITRNEEQENNISGSKIIDIETAYVFKGKEGRYTPDYVSKSFLRARRKAKLQKEVRYHGLRHSFTAYLNSQGVPIFSIQTLLGHSTASMTEIYSHLQVSDLRKAINCFNH